jgi:hypothetical protein
MCNRVVWFDHGVVAMDGDGKMVVNAYAESIRAQEEQRLRLKKQAQLGAAQPVGTSSQNTHLLIEIQGRDGQPQPCPIYFAAISLRSGDRAIAQLPLGDSAFDDPSGSSHLVQEGGSWGEVSEWHGRVARPMLNYGSPFHKVVGVLAVPREWLSADDLQVVLDYWSDDVCELRLRCYRDTRADEVAEFSTRRAQWATHAVPYVPNGTGRWQGISVAPDAPGMQGAADILITDFAMLNTDGAEVHTVRHGESVSFRIGFKIAREHLRERAQVFLVFSRNTTERVCKFMTNELMFDQMSTPAGAIEMRLPQMPLGAGNYSVAVEIAAEGYIEKANGKYFSVDPDVYHCISHALDFTVTDSGWIGDGTIFEGEGEWTITPATRETRV